MPENPKPFAWLKQLSKNRWSIYCQSGEKRPYKVGKICRCIGWKSGISYCPVPTDCLEVIVWRPKPFKSGFVGLMFDWNMEAFLKMVIVPVKTLKESLKESSPGIKVFVDASGVLI